MGREAIGLWVSSVYGLPDFHISEESMTFLVTGAAGFIGFHLCESLLARGEKVIGIDSLNTYYDVTLKEARLAQLERKTGFSFHRINIADTEAILDLAARNTNVTHIVNLAAQAGVRHSLTHPRDYTNANLDGFLEILELARHLPRLKHLVYASSSSVYGANTKLPFSVEDQVDHPVSLYAASKKANELMAHSYSHLYGIPATGLRFFTVYGPWGRPDMAAYIFTRAILAGEPIQVFNNGEMRRDFTYVDDIVSGVVACLDRPPQTNQGAPHKVYNIGNHRSENLLDFVAILEKSIGKKAEIQLRPMQPGDVKDTYADIEATARDFGFRPTTTIEEGLPKFVQWYRAYHKV
jgi:UDP-glucuronate 4-epimerase